MPENSQSQVPRDDEEQALIARYNRKSLEPNNKLYKPWENNGEPKSARQENCCKSIQLFCCPRLTICSFIAIISIIEIVIFIISLCIYGLSDEDFLAPAPQSLAVMGMADAKSTKNDYEYYRLIMPAFLHGHLDHIAGNVVFQLFIGSGIEYGIGAGRMAILYGLSSVGGVLFAIVLHPEDTAVGASCAGYGLLGFYLAYTITNWSYMARSKERPYQQYFILFLSLLWFFMNMGLHFRSDYWQSENLGHQGGYVTGFFVGLALAEQYDYNAQKAGRTPDRFTDEEYLQQSCYRRYACARLGLILLIIWFVALITLFYAWTDVDVEQN